MSHQAVRPWFGGDARGSGHPYVRNRSGIEKRRSPSRT
jgi:hypothetical protein